MMLAGKLNLAQGAVYSEENVNFYATQIQLMQSAEVTAARKPWSARLILKCSPFRWKSASTRPRTSIFDSRPSAPPDYTQAYLNAVMQKYLDFKKGMREDRAKTSSPALPSN